MTDNNGKKTIKKDTKASIGSNGLYYGEIGESQEILQLKTPRQINKKEVSAKKDIVEKLKKEIGPLNEKKGELEKTEDNLDHEDDIFDEEGNIIEDESALNLKIAQLKEIIAFKLSELVQSFREKLEGPVNKVKTITLKIFTVFLSVLGKVFKEVNQAFSKMLKINKIENIQENVPENENIEEKPAYSVERQFIKAKFNDMANLNVLFTDNYDIALYKKKKTGNQEFSKTEESIMMLNAIDSIKQCAEFTKDVPPGEEGAYKGIPISKVMTEVKESDISLFLGFVKAKPQKYTGKSWKISETFATWLVNNAPLAEKK